MVCFTCGGVHLWSTRFCCRPFPFIFSRQLSGLRPSTAIGGNGGVNLLFGTVDVLFGTVDRESVGNEARANLLLLLPLWTALGEAQWSTPIHLPTPSASPVSSSPRTAVASTPSKRTTCSAVPLQQTANRSRFSPMDSRPSSPDRPHLQPNRAPKWCLIHVGPHISSCFLLFRCRL
jgi:hypothetical protein